MADAKKSMTKAQIVAYFAEKFNLPKKTAVEIVDGYAELATTQAKKFKQFTMPGIGKLVVVQRKARKAHNPQDPTKIINIPAKKVVKIRTLKACTEAVLPKK